MKRVFISFRIEDKPQINGLRLLASNPKFEIEFYDESVRREIKSNTKSYIRSKIMEKINKTSVTLCMVSASTHTSEWVDWELETSLDKGNKLICMGLPNGPSRITLPKPARDAKVQWHLWDYNHLGQLITAA